MMETAKSCNRQYFRKVPPTLTESKKSYHNQSGSRSEMKELKRTRQVPAGIMSSTGGLQTPPRLENKVISLCLLKFPDTVMNSAANKKQKFEFTPKLGPVFKHISWTLMVSRSPPQSPCNNTSSASTCCGPHGDEQRPNTVTSQDHWRRMSRSFDNAK
jgi:hypothetical protein